MPSKRTRGAAFGVSSNRLFNQLAARNVKKSKRDYFIYFFTLTLSVALFYSFNSISTQFASLGLEDKLNYLAFSSGVLTAFSILVCFIMGALVVYANRFLLRRRKKEMGVYAILGMERRDLNRLLMRETMRIGGFSLIAGLILGIFAAQILSLITAKLAGLSVSAYRFMISGKGIILSIIFFGILFFIVHLFNVKELKKMTLLDMFCADRKNETVAGERQGVAVLVMILSLFVMAGGYTFLFLTVGKDAYKAIGLGGLILIVGTLLFFTSSLRAMTGIMKKNKWSYFRGLNMFTSSQFSARLKTEGRSGAMIAVLLFLSLTLTMLGPGIGKYVMNGIEYASPYDGTVFYSPLGVEEATDGPMETLKNAGFEVDEFSDSYTSFWIYDTPFLTTGFLIEQEPGQGEDTRLTIIGLEDYNRLLALQGEEPVTLGEAEYAISYAFPPIEKTLKSFVENPRSILLGGAELTLAEQGIYRHAWENKDALIEQGTIIIPQSLTASLTPSRWILDFNFSGDSGKAHERLYDKWFMTAPEGYQLMAGQEVLISITADNLLTTYLGLYLGITFLITSGAVLALQQLSQATDNVNRYELLRKLGASGRDMRRSLTRQLKVYFGLPMFLAVINSAVVVGMVFRLFDGLAVSVIVSIVGFGVLLTGTVYLVYFITTYVGSRRILNL